MTGFYRTGCCETGPEDLGAHVVCVEVTAGFLEFSKARGNDLSTPLPAFGFPGLKPGDRWCLCAARWQEALDGRRGAAGGACARPTSARSSRSRSPTSSATRSIWPERLMSTAPQHSLVLHRPAALRHHPGAGQSAHQHAAAGRALPPGRGVPARLCAEPDLHAVARDHADRPLPGLAPRPSQRQRVFPARREAGDQAVRRGGLRLRPGRQVPPQPGQGARGAPGRWLPDVSLEPSSDARSRPGASRLPPVAAARERRRPGRALRRARGLLRGGRAGGAAPDHLVHRDGDALHPRAARRTLAAQPQPVRPAPAVRPAASLSRALRPREPCRRRCSARATSSARRRSRRWRSSRSRRWTPRAGCRATSARAPSARAPRMRRPRASTGGW